MNKPKIFIGSSVEGLEIAYAVQQNLSYNVEVTVWSQGVFELSMTSIESLISILEQSDFAIFIFSPDDIIKIREIEHITVRDNVIFELGLFIGKLGRERTFIILPDKIDFHIPTDLLGITTGKFETNRLDGNFQAATGPVCHQIRTQINKIGKLNNSEIVSEGDTNNVSEVTETKKTVWWDFYFDKDYEKALESIDIAINKSKNDDEKSELNMWKYYVKYKINSNETKTEIIKTINDDNDNLSLYKAFSRILIYQDELELAKKIIEDGLKKFPTDEGLIIRKADYYNKIGKINDSLELLLSLNYLQDLSLINQIIDNYENSDTDKNIQFEFILKMYVNNPSSDYIAFKLARLSQELGKDKIAIYILDKLFTKDKENINYLGSLGNCCVNLELNNKALIYYKKANELANSEQGWLLANIGNVLNNRGFYDEAKQYLNSSIKVQPESDYSYNRLSSALRYEEEENKLYKKIIQEGFTIINEEFEKLKNLEEEKEKGF